MPLQHFAWKEPEVIPGVVQDQLNDFSTPFQSILFQRGVTTSGEAIELLVPSAYPADLDLQMRHLDKACNIIRKSIQANKKIIIYGDYDADGITSTAILTLALKKITANIIPFLPNRFNMGYGLNKQIIQSFSEQEIGLVITVDNGIRSHAETDFAKSLGIEMIITDHHSPDSVLPDAGAVINPKCPDDTYPNKHLAGVGVVYKLICALATIFPEIAPLDYIDLVAIGTVADVVPLIGENRYLVHKGLSLLNNKVRQRQSLASLIGAANLSGRKITSSDISFQIAPRLNAAGRLDIQNPDIPLKLLLSSDPSVTGRLAQELENYNFQRRILSQELQENIEVHLGQDDRSRFMIMSFSESNHPGVAGIAAGYLTRKYYLPAIVGQIGQEYTIASCRSIPEFNVLAALDKQEALFERYGGHKMAAGFTIQNEKLDILQEKLSSTAEAELSDLDLIPSLSIDAIIDLGQITPSLIKELEKLEPTGSNNPQALFMTRDLKCIRKSLVGKKSDHLRMSVSNGDLVFNTIGFGLGEKVDMIEGDFDMAYRISENHYQGRREIQLQIVDIRPRSE